MLFFHPLSRRRDSLACTKLNLPLKIDASRLAFIVGEFRRARVTPLRVHLDARACAPILNPSARSQPLCPSKCRPIKDNSNVSMTTLLAIFVVQGIFQRRRFERSGKARKLGRVNKKRGKEEGLTPFLSRRIYK